MRRQAIIQAVKTILNDLESSGLTVMLSKGLENIRRQTKEGENDWISFQAFQKFSILSHSYGEAEIEILRIFELDRYMDATFWASLTEAQPGTIHSLNSQMRFVIRELPKIIDLLSQEYVEDVKNQDRSTPKQLIGMEILSIILTEDKGQFSSPSRLVYTLDAVTLLYEAIATLESLSPSDLAVLACDSGSDKSFDFLGLAKVMEELRTLILGVWDRRVQHKHQHISLCMDNIAKSLPILEKIEAMKNDQSLGAEQAELLKRKIIEGTTKFLEVGAHIPEMNNATTPSPRALMRPEPKLLVGPSEGHSTNDDRPETISADTDPCLSPEEEAEFERLMKKRRNNI